MKNVKFTTVDKNGYKWEKEGDFGLVAVGETQLVDGKEAEPEVEVDITATSLAQMKFMITTILLIVYKASPETAEAAVDLYKEKTT